jgi:hypothetical protein
MKRPEDRYLRPQYDEAGKPTFDYLYDPVTNRHPKVDICT